jgi:hypothetical protein
MSPHPASPRTDNAYQVEPMAADRTLHSAQAPQRQPPPRTQPVPAAAQPPSPSQAPSVAELAAAYATAEERWRRALKAANSGRPVDLAELALAQEAYVAAGTALRRAQREESEQSRRMAEMRARRMEAESRLAVIVAQEQAWREVAHSDGSSGSFFGRLGRIFRRNR